MASTSIGRILAQSSSILGMEVCSTWCNKNLSTNGCHKRLRRWPHPLVREKHTGGGCLRLQKGAELAQVLHRQGHLRCTLAVAAHAGQPRGWELHLNQLGAILREVTPCQGRLEQEDFNDCLLSDRPARGGSFQPTSQAAFVCVLLYYIFV